MDARSHQAALAVVCWLLASAVVPAAHAGNFRTENFLVTAATPELAKQVAHEAERYRRELAIEWLGVELPRWPQPCPIQVEVGPQLGAGGATSFSFDQGEVFGWQMEIKGPHDRLLDSVLPHEITHTVFATHFRRPVPRWADEGACSTIEHESERTRLDQHLINYLHTDRGIAFSRMFAMKEYPRDILPLYAQGYSLARFLIAQGGRRKFVTYLTAGMQTQDWIAATRDHYGFQDLRQLQNNWLEWVRQGCPPVDSAAQPGAQPVSLAEQPRPGERNVAAPRGPILRAQSADEPVTAAAYVPSTESQPASKYLAGAKSVEQPAAEPPARPVDNTPVYLSAQASPTPGPTPASEPAASDAVSEAGWTPIRSRTPAVAQPRAALEARPASARQLPPIGSAVASAPAPERRGVGTVLLEWAKPGVEPGSEQVELAPTADVLPAELAGGAEPRESVAAAATPAGPAGVIPRWNRPEMSDLPRSPGVLRR